MVNKHVCIKCNKQGNYHDEWQRIVDEIYPLSQKEQLTKEDYNQIKKIQKQTNTLSKKITNDPILKSFVEDCLNSLKELEKEVPNREKTTGNYENCFHRNIQWDNSSNENPYCVDCGTTDDNSTKFLKALRRFYYRKIEQWLRSNNLKVNSATLGENNYSLYRQLVSNDFAEVKEIHQTYYEITKKLNEIAQREDLNGINNNSRERERERERETTILLSKHNYALKSCN